MGGGDALMSLLGLVIISFGFRVYTQRETMRRHFPEIVGATILSSVFSLFSTAFAAKAIGLSAGLCLSVGAAVCRVAASEHAPHSGRCVPPAPHHTPRTPHTHTPQAWRARWCRAP
jgi:hypothetical protein